MASSFAIGGLLLVTLVVLGVIVFVCKMAFIFATGSKPREIPHADRNGEERELAQVVTTIGKIDAIKAYRARHKCALVDAAAAIDSLIATGNLPQAHATISAPATPRISEADEERILLPILKNEGKIAAIKRYRELSGSGLAEAKARIEFLEERAPLLAAQSNAMPGHIPDELKD